MPDDSQPNPLPSRLNLILLYAKTTGFHTALFTGVLTFSSTFVK